MKKLIGVILGSLMVFALNTTVQAAEYNITVEVDEITAGDIAMVEDFLNSAAEGATVSRSLRRVVMAAVGEIDLALNARVDSYGSLTLDDGGVVALADGDSVTVGKPEDEEFPENVVFETGRVKLTITFLVFVNPSTNRVRYRPLRLCLVDEDNIPVVNLTIPPSGVGAGCTTSPPI